MTKCPICTDNTHNESSQYCILCKGDGKVKSITSVNDFLYELMEKNNKDDKNFLNKNNPNVEKYYRGEAQYYDGTSLQPSIMRKYKYTGNNAIKDEHVLFRDIISRCPRDFQGMNSTFEKLVKMQHYFLPTRLLDITQNPLIALYFACEGNNKKDGIVYIFEIDKKNIRFFDSDTVSIISNLSKIEKQPLLPKENFKGSEQYEKLLFQIHQEKANFEDKIISDDLSSIQCVAPKYDNERIKAQSGAFFIFGIDETIPHEAVANIYKNNQIKIKGLLIDKTYKEKILEELERLNIHKASLFPEIDSVAIYIKDKYERISKVMDDIKKSTQKTTEQNFEEQYKKSTNTVYGDQKKNSYHEFLICNKILDNEKVREKFYFPRYVTSKEQKEFIKLLFGSFSLSFDEKKKVLDRLKTLSKFQFNSLIDVFYEENEKFYSLFEEYPNDIVKLSIQAVKIWHQLIYDGKNLKNYLENFFSCIIYDNEDFKNSYYIHLLNLVLENADLYEKKQLQEILTKIESCIGTLTEKFLAILFEYEENGVVNETLYDFLIQREKILDSDIFTRFYQSIGILYAKKKDYKGAFTYFDKIKNKDCILDYVEMALMIDKIDEAESYLKDKHEVCNESREDYDVLHRLFSIIIDCIKQKDDKNSSQLDGISQKAENLWNRVSRLTTIELNWDFSEIEAIISKNNLGDIVKDTDLHKIIKKIAANKKEDSLKKKLATSGKQRNKRTNQKMTKNSTENL